MGADELEALICTFSMKKQVILGDNYYRLRPSPSDKAFNAQNVKSIKQSKRWTEAIFI